MLEGAAQVVKTWGVIYTEHLSAHLFESFSCCNALKRQTKVQFGEEWMAVKPDRWIRRKALEHKMIEPFTDRQVREGVISYGVSSYGYDIRVADEFRIFTNVNSTIVDPKHFDPKSFVEFKGEVSYKDKKGKYQAQSGIVLPRL